MYYIVEAYLYDCEGNSMKYTKDQNDMMKHFQEQRSFMKRSMHSYDSGFEDEAQRIATIIRILLHDTKNQTSLLNHMNIKNKVQFLSTAEGYIPANKLSYEGLLETSSNGYYIPMNSASATFKGIMHQFDDWWNQIILDDKVNLFSRKDLILEVADTDGGAHVDHKLNEAYALLTKNHTLSGSLLINGESHPLRNNPVYACIRQIASELLYSIDLSENIKSCIRKSDQKTNYFANYIGDKIYFIHTENLNHPLFEDSRITKSEDRKHYIDNINFLNGLKGEIHFISS